MDKKDSTSVHYHSYLQLEKLLSAQKLRSEELDKPAHDEMLFIIVHQVYELWFKQIIHELNSVIDMFEDDMVDEKEISVALSRLDRVAEIQQLLIHQIRVIETLTPMDFLDFRNFLFPASGFQSFQFRLMEVMLGLKVEERLKYNEQAFNVVFTEERREQLRKLEKNKSLLEYVDAWLCRTPFLEFDNFNFLEEYRKSVRNMLEREKKEIMDSDILSEESKQSRLKMLGDTDDYFTTVFSADAHEKALKEGRVKFSHRATIAALWIFLYRDEPILQMPYRLLARLMDMEEFFTTWRYRHAQMVLRMIGRKTGTGGSSGYDYLHATASKHRIFSDLYNISTLLIPRSELPDLPAELRRNLGFYYTWKDEA